MRTSEKYMHRCIELAKRGFGHVAPNPMVGAVLVYNDVIIGEGWHQQYGQAHAEVNCIENAVANGHTDLISQSNLYVSLEPCAHFGKTPPCADLIIEKKIPHVIIGCRDPFFEVNGKGIEKLNAAGVKTEFGILENECRELNKRFFTFHKLKRPYIILKWAETKDKMIGTATKERLLISNDYTKQLVHKWRAEEMAILVGTNTAQLDDPSLTTRNWPGPSPIRLVIDMDLKLPPELKLFNNEAPTIIFNTIRHDLPGGFLKIRNRTGPFYYQVTNDTSLVHQILNALYQLKIQSLIVEGGARLLQSFINEGMWDEVRKITGQQSAAGSQNVSSPILTGFIRKEEFIVSSDTIEILKPSTSLTDPLTN